MAGIQEREAASVGRPTSGAAVRWGLSGQGGFTLIELLVVVAIVGILAAIAIPAFSAYRADSYDAHSVVALNTLAKAEEAYFIGSGRYADQISQLPPYYPPNGVVLTIVSADAFAFEATASHPRGNKTFRWKSTSGGLQP